MKKGRPHKENGKVYQYRLRLTKEEKTLLEKIANEEDLTKSEVLIKGLKCMNSREKQAL